MIDFSRYNRLFTFGCSFTTYIWPTWADITSQEMPNAEFLNLGIPGSGNLSISVRIAEANHRFKFTESDLVMVMYSSASREDRWIEDKWEAHGNVYNNDFYDDHFIKKYTDERGYLIRDAGLIDLSCTYLESLPCTSYTMLGFPLRSGAELVTYGDPILIDESIYKIYNNRFKKFKPDFWSTCDRTSDYSFADGHPSPIKYYNYLKFLGFKLTEKSEQYAIETTNILKMISNRDNMDKYFPIQDKNTSKSRNDLF